MTGTRSNTLQTIVAAINRRIDAIDKEAAELRLLILETVPTDEADAEIAKDPRLTELAAERSTLQDQCSNWQATMQAAASRDFQDAKDRARRDAVAAHDAALAALPSQALAREIDRTVAKLGELTRQYLGEQAEAWNHGFNILQALREVQHANHWETLVQSMRNTLDNAMPRSLENAIVVAGLHKITGPISPATQCDPNRTVEAATRRSHDEFKLRLGEALAKMPEAKEPDHG